MRKSKRISAFLLAMVMLMTSSCPSFAENDNTNRKIAKNASADTIDTADVICIKNEKELLEFAKNCRLDTWSKGKSVILQTDISLAQMEFEPIPTFAGSFDGNGHTISDLNLTGNLTPAGLFGQIQETGVVKNLTVSGTIRPAGEGSCIGGIVGENSGTVTGCVFIGDVTGTDDTGGIAGINGLTGEIDNCHVSGTISGSDRTGGIAGSNLGNIKMCHNEAETNTVRTEQTVRAEDINLDFLTDLSKLSSAGSQTATMDTGGIAGYSTGVITECTNQGAVGYPRFGYNVGGIVGRNSGYVDQCENKAEIQGRKDVGGIAGQMEPAIMKNLTESGLAELERQLSELDTLLSRAIGHVDDTSDQISDRLNGIAESLQEAGNAAEEIRTVGTLSSTVTGKGETSAGGSVTVTPAEGSAGGSVTVTPAENDAEGSTTAKSTENSAVGSSDAGGGSSVSVEIDGSIAGGVEGEGHTSADVSLDAQTQMEISTNLSDLSASIYKMAGQMSVLTGEMSDASKELTADVRQIQSKINEITETGLSLLLGEESADLFIDSSQENMDKITLGKLASCENSAAIQGDINVGGITGEMGMEHTLDPEDDVVLQIDQSVKRKYELKAVIWNCKNMGTVTGKKNHVGGVTGKMNLGLIAQCESYGTVSSENGDYVGGIVGLCSSTIRKNYAKCVLSGGKYVGGIVGSGVKEDKTGGSSTVTGCYSMVEISDYEQYGGAISGEYAGIFAENYFVSEELTGINRISYTGIAQPISYEEMMKVEGLPQEFRQFTLEFLAEEEVIWRETFDYGASFSEDKFPDIPQKEGYSARWDRETLEELTFDTKVNAVYTPYHTSLSSENVRDDHRNIFFVEGQFGETEELAVTRMTPTPGEFAKKKGIFGFFEKKQHKILEQWRLEFADDGLDSHQIRYLPPEGEKTEIYVRKNGTWEKTETKQIGSYLVFQVSGTDVQIAAVKK